MPGSLSSPNLIKDVYKKLVFYESGVLKYDDGSSNQTILTVSSLATITGSETLTNKTLTSPVLNTGVSGSAVLDEDNMASNSATKLATQQSIKAYVDTSVNTELVQDIVGAMIVTNGSHTNITASYDDAGDGAIDLTATGDVTLTNSVTLTNKTLTSPVLNGSISGTSIKDEDNMSSDSASHIATQQSIKAYVDSQVTAQDLDISADSGSNIAIDLDSEVLEIAGGEGIDTSITGNAVTIAGEEATTSNKGVASFSSDNFAVSSGVVTIKDSGVILGTETTGNYVATAVAGEGIDVSGATGNVTISAEDATDSNKGIASFSTDNFSVSSGVVTVKDSGIANAELAGSIANSKLSNSSITINGSAIALGGSVTTPNTNQLTTFIISDDDGDDVTVSQGKYVKFLGGSGVSTDWTDTSDGSSSDEYDLTISADHDGLTNFVADEHIDHTSVTITAGDGLSGGGTIAANRTIALDLNELGTETSIAQADFVAMVDATDNGSQKITFSNLEDQIFGNVSGDITIAAGGAATIANNSVALGTDTTGNYLAAVQGTSNEIEVTGSAGEGATFTIGLPDDVTIAGDLTVNGDTVTVSTATLDVEDPLIKLAKGNNAADSVDIGFYGLYDTSGSQDLYAGLFRDANDSGKWKLFKDLQAAPTTTVNTSGTGYAVGTLVASLEGTVTTATQGTIDHDSLANFVANEHIDWTSSSAGTIHSTNYTNTTYTAGTNISLSGTQFNVDDAFLKNDANDTTSGTITAGGFTTTGTWTFDDYSSGTVGITTVHTGTSFNDNDTSLMTAGAIKEYIDSRNFGSGSGDITAVVAGDGLTGGANSGSATLDIGAGTGIDVASDAISVDVSDFMTNGSDNRIVTATGTDAMNAEANLTFGGTNLSIAAGGKLQVDEVEGKSNNTNTLLLNDDQTAATNMVTLQSINHINIMTDGNNNGTGNFAVYNGSYDVDTADLAFRITSTGLARFENDIDIPATDRIYLDGRGNTYITESSSDNVSLYAGGQQMMVWSEGTNDLIYVPDGLYLGVGSDVDMYMRHNGSNSWLTNSTGDLYITNDANDKDIILSSDDGSGGSTAYITLDGSAERIQFSKKAYILDNVKFEFGDGADLQIYHDSSNSYIDQAGTGHLYIRNTTDDKAIFIQTDDGSGGVTDYMKFIGNENLIRTYKDFRVQDSVQVQFGSDADCDMLHDGSEMIIRNDTGNFTINQRVDDGDIILKCDDGSGGVTAYLTLDGSATRTNVAKDLRLDDSVNFQLGSGGDCGFSHDGTDTLISNATGHLTIQTSADDKDLIFKCDNGSGGLTNYIQLDGSEVETVFNQKIKIEDSKNLAFGAGRDATIQHDGSNTYFSNGTGNLYISTDTNDGDLVLRCDDGSGGIATYITLDGSATKTTLQKDLRADDDVKIQVGSSGDLYLVHDGSNSDIINGTGDLVFRNNADDKDIKFKCDDGSGGVTDYLTLDGSAGYTTAQKTIAMADDARLDLGTGNDFKMWHDGSHNYMQLNNGNLYFRDDGSNNIFTIYREGAGVQLNEGDFVLGDSQQIEIGNRSGGDMQIYHDGSNNYINASEGHLVLEQNENDHDIILKSDNGSGGTAVYMTLDGSVVRTVFDKPAQFNDELYVADNAEVRIGDGNDLRLLHNGSNSFIDNYTGALYIRNHADDGDIYIQVDDGGSNTINALTIDTSEVAKFQLPNDYQRLTIGASADLQFVHDATNTYMENYTGDLYITNYDDDKDIVLRSDDGSGGVTQYIRIDGSAGLTQIDKDMKFVDDVKAQFGDSSDFQINHDGSHTYLNNGTGNLYINENTNDGDLVLQCDDGSGGTTAYITLDGSEENINFFGTRIYLKSDGTFHWGSAGAHGVLSWDTGRAIVSGLGTNNLDLKAASGYSVVVNESGSNVDFRVEGDSDANLLFTDAGNDRVGIGTGSPGNYKLHVAGTSYFSNQMRIVGATDVGLVVESTDGTSLVGIQDNSTGGDYYNGVGAVGNELFLKSNNSERVRIDSSGRVGIGTNNPSELLHIVSSSGDARILLDAPDGDDCEIKFYNAGTVQYTVGYDDGADEFCIGTSNVDTGVRFALTDNGVNIRDGGLGVDIAPSTTDGRIDAANDVVAYSTSDKRLKENIKPLDNALDKVMQISGVEFDWKKLTEKEKETIHGNEGHDVGVIAQEIEEVLPEVVTQRDSGYKAVKYEKIVPLLIEAIKEQQKQIQELKNG